MSNIIRVRTVNDQAEELMKKVTEDQIMKAMKSGKEIDGIVVMRYINLDRVISVSDPVSLDKVLGAIDENDMSEEEAKEFLKVLGFGDMTSAFSVSFSKDYTIVVDGLYYNELIERWRNVS